MASGGGFGQDGRREDIRSPRGLGAASGAVRGEDRRRYAGTASRLAASASSIPAAVVLTQVKIGTSVSV